MTQKKTAFLLTISTLGELRKSGWESLPVKDEIKKNLVERLKSHDKLFPGIYGYEKSIEVQLTNAILSGHNIILLGLRGQGKTKLIRLLSDFLDEYSPAIAGTELNEDPFHPISPRGKEITESMGDKTPIRWIHRSERYNEKLATPDVSIADLIGDIDPIKAAREKINISDNEAIHWGIIPRSNRGIFSINELPDLQPRIQVSLFNILEENDIQIRGFPLRLPLDILLVFTANPEDYTNRGQIITPLKDRINSQIITHYPKSIEVSKQISLDQITPGILGGFSYPEDVLNIIENISFIARRSDFVDKFSGVSQRLAISAIENYFSNLQRRKLQYDKQELPRVMDLFSTVPAITGKVELIEERGEEELIKVATTLISESIKEIFDQHFPPVIDHDQKDMDDEVSLEYQSIVKHFKNGSEVRLSEEMSDQDYEKVLFQVAGLKKIVEKHAPSKNFSAFYGELVLESLYSYKVINRQVSDGYLIFNDLFTSMFQKF